MNKNKTIRYIILVSGFAGSGKDLFADYIIKTMLNCKKLAFADILKKQTAFKYGFDYNLTLTQSGKATEIKSVSMKPNKKFMTIRDLLIEEAALNKTEEPDIYARNTYDNIIKGDMYKDIKHVIISDFRYKNEYEYLLERFEKTNSFNRFNKIYQTNVVITLRIDRFDESSVDSESETQLNDFNFDYIVKNRHGINKFYEKINTFVNDIDLVKV
jgi:hypothetical protein